MWKAKMIHFSCYGDIIKWWVIKVCYYLGVLIVLQRKCGHVSRVLHGNGILKKKKKLCMAIAIWFAIGEIDIDGVGIHNNVNDVT